VLFQQCCYGYWGQLLTTPSFEAGSALLYNPRFYWSLHYQYDVQPKEWCCLYSDNCNLYYRVRPLDRCFGYRFPWFSEYSMTMMMTTTRTLIRPPDVSQEGLRFYPKTLFIYFLSIHRAQQPRSG